MAIKQKAVKTAKKSVVGIPFVKGDPRINTKGRPKVFSLVDMLRRKLQDKGIDKNKILAEEFVDTVLRKAVVDGDVTMMRDVFDRIDGKPRQNIGIDGGAEDKPILHSEIAFKTLQKIKDANLRRVVQSSDPNSGRGADAVD